jgi:hypothetical protein
MAGLEAMGGLLVLGDAVLSVVQHSFCTHVFYSFHTYIRAFLFWIRKSHRFTLMNPFTYYSRRHSYKK